MPPKPKKPLTIAQALLASPTADSLWNVSGGNRPATAATGLLNIMPRQPDGAYNPIFDIVALNTSSESAKDPHELRNVLIHEAGHRVRARGFGFGAPGNKAPFKLPDGTPSSARAKVDEYYQSSPNEGYAQAFRNAYNMLSYSAPALLSDPTITREKVLNALAQIEARTPGAGEIVRDLLKKDIFRGHPMSKFVR